MITSSCHGCGRQSDAQRSHCEYCGVLKLRTYIVEKAYCDNCGEELYPHFSFCVKCNSPKNKN